MVSSPTENTPVDDLPGPSRPPTHWRGGWPQSIADFEAFIDVFQDRLVYAALRRLGDLQDAEDVVQEVFVKAYCRREKYREVERVAPYLYRMTATACSDFGRRRKAVVLIPLDQLQEIDLPSNGNRPDETAIALEEVRRIEAILSRLPISQGEVIRLRVFDELSLTEIAKVLSCSLPTVKSRLRYGLRKLREWFIRERGQH